MLPLNLDDCTLMVMFAVPSPLYLTSVDPCVPMPLPVNDALVTLSVPAVATVLTTSSAEW
ncbi:MAG: hypothetical protein IPI73_25150 [Betaproteobacteria bacterium]|nr:hypothetical protein [Betaproteobacteria bacterium]